MVPGTRRFLLFSLLATLALGALCACAAKDPAKPFNYPAAEAQVNSAPHQMCVDYCFGTSGGNTSDIDRAFCEDRCKF